MHQLILCAVFKNESHILSEWIQHYLQRGVDHIYLINDHSTDDYRSIIERYGDKITLFHNDIITKDVGRQMQIYEKYVRPILSTSKWAMVLDLDEFLYSPTNQSFYEILESYSSRAQLKVDWLHFGSNGHEIQPISAVAGFTKRANFTRQQEYYSFKTIFQTEFLKEFAVHEHKVQGLTIHLAYDDDNPPPLVINHYNLQSRDFYMNVKGTRGDINNWFDHIKRERDTVLFEQFDRNEVEDLRLFHQNKKLIDLSPMLSKQDEVSLIITSCNRPHLLEKTLASFVQMNTFPIHKTFIIDDSGTIGCNDKVIESYRERMSIVSLYNKTNIGQIQSIDKVYSYVRTKWIFHCEEDWEFLQPQFIEKSMKVFQDNPTESIYTVWLRPHHSTSSHPIITDELNRGYYLMNKDFSYECEGTNYIWGGITFNPGLRKTVDCLLHHPYTLCCDTMKHREKEYVGEYTVNKKYVESGYYSMILSDPKGHVDHIGWNDHITREWE
jgi:glycosyltransferase involved in cell wall biosynthesis